jgi:lyso-ornithine lipid O-acyltransferase
MTTFLKFAAICRALISFSIRGLIIQIMVHDTRKKRIQLANNTAKAGKDLVRILGFKLKIVNPEIIPTLSLHNHLFIANHISYTDIMVLASLYPMLFITSREMGNTPFLGQLTHLGGSLYTDRRHIATLKNEINAITAVLSEGFNLGLFPEGTSYNGDTVHPFKKSLFESAIRSKTPIQPICIKYISIDGKPFDLSNRDQICWYGDMAFVPHFPNLMKLKEIVVEITLLNEIPIEEGMDRQQLSDLTFNKINEVFQKYKPLV